MDRVELHSLHGKKQRHGLATTKRPLCFGQRNLQRTNIRKGRYFQCRIILYFVFLNILFWYVSKHSLQNMVRFGVQPPVASSIMPPTSAHNWYAEFSIPSSIFQGKRKLDNDFAPEFDTPRPAKRSRFHGVSDIDHYWPLEAGDVPTESTEWHQGDRFMKKLNPVQLLSLTYPKRRLDPSNPLAYGDDFFAPIHPLFSPLLTLSSSVPLLLPPLRLGTRFLTSRHVLPFFHTLMFSPLTILPAESQYYNTPIYHLPESPYSRDPNGLPEPLRMLTMQTLLALVTHIDIQISPDPRLTTRWAYTERSYPPSHSRSKGRYRNLRQVFEMPCDISHLHHQTIFHRQDNPRHRPPLTHSQTHLLTHAFTGTNAQINLSPTFLTLLHPHTYSSTHAQSDPTIQRRGMFLLAITLLHELAHAVYMVRIPPPTFPLPTSPHQSPTQTPEGFQAHFKSQAHDETQTDPKIPEYEPFYATDRKPELGHALESTLFSSSTITSLANDTRFRLGLGCTPLPDASEFYVRNFRGKVVPLTRISPASSEGVSAGESGGVRHLKAGRWEEVFVLGSEWVGKWFWREFWEGGEGGDGGGTGKCGWEGERGFGVRCENFDFDDAAEGPQEDGNGERAEDEDEDGEDYEYVEGGGGICGVRAVAE